MGFSVPDYEIITSKNIEQNKESQNFDIEMAVDAFRSTLISLNSEERKAYLKEINLKYDKVDKIEEKINLELLYIYDTLKTLNFDSRNYFLSELLTVLEYDKKIDNLQKNDTEKNVELKKLERNAKIISCIHPELNFNKMLYLFNTPEEKINFIIKCRELIDKYDIKTCLDGYGVQKIK